MTFINFLGETVFLSESHQRFICDSSGNKIYEKPNDIDPRFLRMSMASKESIWFCALSYFLQNQNQSLMDWFKFHSVMTVEEKSSLMFIFLQESWRAYFLVHHLSMDGQIEVEELLVLQNKYYQFYHSAFSKLPFFGSRYDPVMISCIRLWIHETKPKSIYFTHPVPFFERIPLPSFDAPKLFFKSYPGSWSFDKNSFLSEFSFQENISPSLILDQPILNHGKPFSSVYDSFDFEWDSKIIGSWVPPKNLHELKMRWDQAFSFQTQTDRQQYLPLNTLAPSQSHQTHTFTEAQSILKTNLESNHISIDNLVLDILEESPVNIKDKLSSEQIDAVGLALLAFSKKQSFILADETGLGKGRILAALTYAFLKTGRKVFFVTEKKNLFSDFWRDLNVFNIEALGIDPFLLHSKGKIYNHNSVIFQTKPKNLKTALDTAESPSPLVFTTYSQFNRDLKTNPRGPLARHFAKDCLLILDESHNAAGDSTTSSNMQELIALSQCTIFSSATYASQPNHLKFYENAIPLHGDELKLLFECLENDPTQNLYKRLSKALCLNGTLVRREHPIEEPLPTELIEVNESDSILFDNLSNIFHTTVSYLFAFALHVDRLKNQKDKGKKSSIWGTLGGLLSRCSRQINLLSKLNTCISIIEKEIQLGRKPVIAMESTFESFLQNHGYDQDEIQDEDIETSSLSLDQVSIQGFMKIIVENISQDVFFGDDHEYQTLKNQCLQSIEKFPIFLSSPLDFLRIELHKKNIKSYEISGRSVELIPNASGSAFELSNRNNLISREEMIFAFNHGDCDVLLLTKAGSTGISLHSSNTFKDQRPRSFIELEIVSNPIQRAQFLGRVRRKGQVCSPFYFSIVTGSPFERRILERAQKKQSSMHSFSSGSSALTSGSFDFNHYLISTYGDGIAYEWLNQNPLDLQMLGIFLPPFPQIKGLSEQLFKRIPLLKPERQQSIYDFFESAFFVQSSFIHQSNEASLLFLNDFLIRKKRIMGQGDDHLLNNAVFASDFIHLNHPKTHALNTQEMETIFHQQQSIFKNQCIQNYTSLFNQNRPIQTTYYKHYYQQTKNLLNALKPFSTIQFTHPSSKQKTKGVFLSISPPENPLFNHFFSAWTIDLIDITHRHRVSFSLLSFLNDSNAFVFDQRIPKNHVLNHPILPQVLTFLSGHCIYSEWLAQQWGDVQFIKKSQLNGRTDDLLLAPNFGTGTFTLEKRALPIQEMKQAAKILTSTKTSLFNHYNSNEATLSLSSHPQGWLLSMTPEMHQIIVVADPHFEKKLSLPLNIKSSARSVGRTFPPTHLYKVLSSIYKKGIYLFKP